MEIVIKNFIIRVTPNASTKFDLSRVVTRKKVGTDETYSGEQDEGYGMSMEQCINKIIYSNLDDKELKVTLKEFIEEFKRERDEVLEITNQLNLKI